MVNQFGYVSDYGKIESNEETIDMLCEKCGQDLKGVVREKENANENETIPRDNNLERPIPETV